jgi:glycosyltransferase involved in cell wall biosynthesis
MTTLMSHFRTLDGFGSSAIALSEVWGEIDPDLRLVDMCIEPPDGYDWLFDDRVVALCTPGWIQRISSPCVIGFTMFESTRLPESSVLALKYCRAVIVPSEFCANTFQESGVTAPIYIVPLGIDPMRDRRIERCREDRPYTFLWSGTADWRKGWDIVYEAFGRKFGADPRVKLILHFRQALPPGWSFGDKNVEVIVGNLSNSQIRNLYQRSDCFVFPSRGEGWGLPPRQAAATGLPVIATDWGGLDDIDRWGLPLPVQSLAPARFGGWTDIGEWAQPDVDALVGWMEWCFTHPERAAVVGCDASRWLSQNQTWTDSVLCLQKVLDRDLCQIGHLIAPAIRSVTLRA